MSLRRMLSEKGEEMTDPLAFLPVTPDIPWGKPVLIEIPEKYWTNDWCQVVRSKTYIGTLCSHYDARESLICIQPPQAGIQHVKVQCVPIKDLNECKLTVLKGKLKDYQ